MGGDFKIFEVTDIIRPMNMFKTSSSYPISILWLLVIFISSQSLENMNLVKITIQTIYYKWIINYVNVREYTTKLNSV